MLDSGATGGGATLALPAAVDPLPAADAAVAWVLCADAEVAFGGGATATLLDVVVVVVDGEVTSVLRATCRVFAV